MKFEEYQKPDLEELEIILEGSFQNDVSPVGGDETGGDKDDTPSGGDFDD